MARGEGLQQILALLIDALHIELLGLICQAGKLDELWLVGHLHDFAHQSLDSPLNVNPQAGLELGYYYRFQQWSIKRRKITPKHLAQGSLVMILLPPDVTEDKAHL